ncbi:CDP-glycerol--poly(glycerophosphate) glycerophosphotransferase [Pseudoalteromonas sp. NBT06-2]|uniref:CDP-glycerol glycerophosphotransferase family protein n=1 Tax=Pseudoalteromonas sp. NBT06-2 TaxID=2025950 RepID=UPI000BA5D878|nr:CDP-glycerol glycerophosphotransferase family protein [Pseudoalteromonas sp. NBT06-2]PAJ75698.1 CDP-glycerol--poly(glycerophosphate) glycerophosphotransferase [Pseudoalteromonas sp. NBT06-2]
MKILFDVKHLYYLPQYMPVYQELLKKNVECRFIFYNQEDESLQYVCQNVEKQEKLPVYWVSSWGNAFEYYQKEKADWIIFGNAVDNIHQLHRVSKTVLMQHGIGPKSCYYDVSKNLTTVRFVEGKHRLNRLYDLYPSGNFVDTGYAKLDPIFSKTNNVNQCSLVDLGLDPNKKTILYAPTFYPSSLECFSKSFPKEFENYNIIVKPHFFSVTKKKYAKQRTLLNSWDKFKNVYLAPTSSYNLLPFMAISDVMISDASSAIFEFSALNKPVIWCDFYKLRWSYRGFFSCRFKKRLDSDIEFFHQLSDRVASYKELYDVVEGVILTPNKKIKLIEQLAGKTDGNCSVRIVDYLFKD